MFEATFGSKFLKSRPRWLEEETGRALELDGYSESLQLASENIKRDPFEQAVGLNQKTAMSIGGALAAPSTAYLYEDEKGRARQ